MDWNDPAFAQYPEIDPSDPTLRQAAERIHANESLHRHDPTGPTCIYCTLNAARALAVLRPAPAKVPVAQGSYDSFACRRSTAWTAQSIVEQAAGLNVADSEDEPAINTPEAWWYYQGRSEAFAEAMTILERDGLATVTLVVTDGASA